MTSPLSVRNMRLGLCVTDEVRDSSVIVPLLDPVTKLSGANGAGRPVLHGPPGVAERPPLNPGQCPMGVGLATTQSKAESGGAPWIGDNSYILFHFFPFFFCFSGRRTANRPVMSTSNSTMNNVLIYRPVIPVLDWTSDRRRAICIYSIYYNFLVCA